MYAKDLINNDNKQVKYYFSKKGKKVSLTVYEDNFVVAQDFKGGKKFQPLPIAKLDEFLGGLKKSSTLIETIRYN